MQYILTEKEYANIFENHKQEIEKYKNLVNRLCIEVAENRPVKIDGDKKASPWGCIQHGESGQEYCDWCPVQEYCTYLLKEYSK